MQRNIQTIPHPSSNTYDVNNRRVYARSHRRLQGQTYFQANKTYRIETNLEQENINNYINNMYKEKKYRGIFDPTAPNNKNIFIETDSEPQKSERNPQNLQNIHKKSTRLLIAKTESQFPETFNSKTVFTRDGLVKGYYIKVTKSAQNRNIINLKNKYNTISNQRKVKTIVHSPSELSEDKIINDNNLGTQTQVRQKTIDNMNLLSQTYNRNTINNTYLQKYIL